MTYAWIIDKDCNPEPGAAPGTNLNAVGMTGPRNADPALLARLAAGEGAKFRMSDDDDEVYYEGRILNTDPGSEEDFGPLDDFGMPNAGAASIEYLTDGEWKVL